MALSPVYTPSVPAIPPNAYFRVDEEKVYRPSSPSNCKWPLLEALEAKRDSSREIKVDVKKSRARNSWDAIWAKPKNWWSHLSRRERHWWGYLFGLLVCGGFCALLAGMTYVTYDHIPQHKSKDWAKYKWTQLGSISEWKSSTVERDTPVLTEFAWPTEVTNVGHLATSTASPSMIAVPFTA
ncbi:hypothetical protein PoHVEF18_008720 [Penicillium ochrochloron]